MSKIFISAAKKFYRIIGGYLSKPFNRYLMQVSHFFVQCESGRKIHFVFRGSGLVPNKDCRFRVPSTSNLCLLPPHPAQPFKGNHTTNAQIKIKINGSVGLFNCSGKAMKTPRSRSSFSSSRISKISSKASRQ